MAIFEIIPSTGQSLCSGAEGTPILNSTPIAKAWMVGESVGGGTGAAREGNVALDAAATVQALKAVGQESWHTGFAKWILANGSQPTDTEFGLAYSGISGESMERMVGGTAPHTKLLALVQRLKDYATRRGLTARVPALVAITGENNSAFWLLGNNPADYKALWITYHARIAADTRAITGQTFDPVIIFDQTSSHGFYCALLSRQGSSSAPPYPTAAIVHAELAAELPLKFVCIGPKYQYSYQHSYGQNSVHLPGSGYERLGEKIAQVYEQEINQNRRWNPLRIKSAKFTAPQTILVDFDIPSLPLQWDTTVLDEGNRGFEYSDTGGSPVTIRGVNIVGGARNQVEIFLSAPPTGDSPVLRSAWENWDKAALTDALPVSPPYPRVMGKVYGPRSQLTDSDSSPSGQAYDHRNYLIHQEIQISNYTKSGGFSNMTKFAVEINDISQYSNGTDAEVWVHPVALSAANPQPVKRIFSTGNTLSGGVLLVSLSSTAGLTPLPSAMPNNVRLETKDGQVFVVDNAAQPLDTATGTRFMAAGSTTLRIVAPTGGLKIGAVDPMFTNIEYIDWMPFYSVESGDMDSTASSTTYRNVGAGAYKIQGKQAMEGKFNTKGYVTKTDPMLRLLQRVNNRMDQWIYMRVIFPDNECHEFAAHVLGVKRGFKVDDPYMTDLSFSIASEPVIKMLTPS